MLKVVKILEGDFGCEERMPGEPKKDIVVLCDEEGHESEILADDDWLYANNINEGSEWKTIQ